MRFAFPVALCFLLALLGAGCDASGDNETPPDSAPSVGGTWTGSTTDDGTQYALTLSLTQGQPTRIGGQSGVGGTGEVVVDAPDDGNGATFPITVSGSFLAPTLTLQMNYENSRPGQLSGTLSDDGSEITATLTGGAPGFDGLSVVLERQ